MFISEKPLLILGGGGHAQVLIDNLKKLNSEIIGITDPKLSKGSLILDVPVLGGDDEVLSYSVETVYLVNGVGSVKDSTFRQNIFNKFKPKGYCFASVVHPSAVLPSEIQLSEGVQIMAGAIIQSGSKVGVNTILNTRCVVDHNCVIGDHVHVAPGGILSGSVCVGDNSHIGTGAVVIQGVKIGESCLVGAGSVVVKDIPPGTKVVGVPAKPVNT